jgi:hypothetical protein
MDAGKRLELLKNEINSILDRGNEQFLEKYKKELGEGEKVYLYIQMWTPLWNDGDMCLPQVDWCMGRDIIKYEYFTVEADIFDGIDSNEIEESKIIEIEERDIKGVIKYLERRYRTNKQCLMVIDSRHIISFIRDYECGY